MVRVGAGEKSIIDTANVVFPVARVLRTALKAAMMSWILVGASGCDGLSRPASPFMTVDVTGSALGSDFRLKDHNAQMRSLDDFRGKVVVTAFGFTNCPDVCPTTLSDLAAALRRLGPDAQRVQVLFFTLDPKRDTPEVLRQYVPAFHPSFLGLWGQPDDVAKVLKDFGMYAKERPGSTAEGYGIDHSAQSYALDAQGRVRLMIPYGTTPDVIARDLRILLN